MSISNYLKDFRVFLIFYLILQNVLIPYLIMNKTIPYYYHIINIALICFFIFCYDIRKNNRLKESNKWGIFLNKCFRMFNIIYVNAYIIFCSLIFFIYTPTGLSESNINDINLIGYGLIILLSVLNFLILMTVTYIINDFQDVKYREIFILILEAMIIIISVFLIYKGLYVRLIQDESEKVFEEIKLLIIQLFIVFNIALFTILVKSTPYLIQLQIKTDKIYVEVTTTLYLTIRYIIDK